MVSSPVASSSCCVLWRVPPLLKPGPRPSLMANPGKHARARTARVSAERGKCAVHAVLWAVGRWARMQDLNSDG
jgi:hypothetical protein